MHRRTANGHEVLLITSRDSGRWIVPKGWPINGLNGAETALREAWEEAGVHKATVCPDPIGHYSYDKRLNNGADQPVETNVYRMEVSCLLDDYPEAHERKRQWVAPSAAANMVQEPQLQVLLRSL